MKYNNEHHRAGRHFGEAGSHHSHHDEHTGYGRRPGRFGMGRGERMVRGALRFILLDALRDGPKHGYEIIKALEERTQSRYAPSPGIVYPTLQLLNDEGLITSDQQLDRRVYKLTEAGQAELAEHTQQVEEFWSKFSGDTASQSTGHEIGFLQDELQNLLSTIWGALRGTGARDDKDFIRQLRREVQQCQDRIRDIIATDPKPSGE
jgi:DNA-binding PadR family transcriptional regulator